MNGRWRNARVQRIRWAIRGITVVCVVVVLWAAWAAYLLSPRHSVDRTELVDHPPADAIVLLAGADDGRHQLAGELLAEGVAPRLLVSNPLGTRERKATALCRKAGAECFEPVPHTTGGEARTIAPMVAQSEWDAVVVVTNKPHAARVGMLFRRCLPGVQVRVVTIDGLDVPMLPLHALREAGGFAKYSLRSGC